MAQLNGGYPDKTQHLFRRGGGLRAGCGGEKINQPVYATIYPGTDKSKVFPNIFQTQV